MYERVVSLAEVPDHGVVLVVIRADVVAIEDDHAGRESASDQALHLAPTGPLPGGV